MSSKKNVKYLLPAGIEYCGLKFSRAITSAGDASSGLSQSELACIATVNHFSGFEVSCSLFPSFLAGKDLVRRLFDLCGTYSGLERPQGLQHWNYSFNNTLIRTRFSIKEIRIFLWSVLWNE